MTCIAKWLLSSTNEFCLEFCAQVSLSISLCYTFYLTFSQWIQLTLNTLMQFMILIFYLIGVLYFCLCTCNGIMEFVVLCRPLSSLWYFNSIFFYFRTFLKIFIPALTNPRTMSQLLAMVLLLNLKITTRKLNEFLENDQLPQRSRNSALHNCTVG